MEQIIIDSKDTDHKVTISIIPADSIQFSDGTMIVLPNIQDIIALNEQDDIMYAYQDCLYFIHHDKGIVYVVENYKEKLQVWLKSVDPALS